MTTLLSLIIFIIIIAFLLLISILFYNGFAAFYWIWKKRYDCSKTEYENKKIMYYKKKIIVITPIIIILGLNVLLYKVPISFEKAIGCKEYPEMVESIYISRANRGILSNIKVADKDEVSDILNTLEEYRYIRSLQESRFGNVVESLGDEFVSLTITLTGNIYIKTFVISNNGYIKDASTGQAYKPTDNSENEMQFYNRLTEVLSDKD